jgi:hypothetical protein
MLGRCCHAQLHLPALPCPSPLGHPLPYFWGQERFVRETKAHKAAHAGESKAAKKAKPATTSEKRKGGQTTLTFKVSFAREPPAA